MENSCVVQDPIRKNVIKLLTENINPFVSERWQFSESERQLVKKTADLIRAETGQEQTEAELEDRMRIRFYIGIKTPEEIFSDMLKAIVQTNDQEGIDEAIRYYIPLAAERISMQDFLERNGAE